MTWAPTPRAAPDDRRRHRRTGRRLGPARRCVECAGIRTFVRSTSVPGCPTTRTPRRPADQARPPRVGPGPARAGARGAALGPRRRRRLDRHRVARTDPRCRAIAVDRTPDGPPGSPPTRPGWGYRVQVVTADVTESLDWLPQPDAIFVGGGADLDLVRRAGTCFRWRPPGGARGHARDRAGPDPGLAGLRR